MKKALITGITGQDGAYLAEFLLNKGYEVHGIKRRASLLNTDRIDHLYKDIHDPDRRLKIQYGDLTDSSTLIRIVQEVEPDEIYNLGAMSHVRVSFDMPEYTANVDALGALRILEAIRMLNMRDKVRYYQASTAEMFGATPDCPQNENSPFHPRSPYGVSKLFAHHITINYRESYGIFACSGILFNHESPLRGETFVTRKITRGLSRIKLGLQDCLYLGNLNAKRDWGHAKDYVEVQWMMLQQDKPEDYVIATGQQYSVRDVVEEVAKLLDINITWKGHGENEVGIDQSGNVIIRIDQRYIRPAEVDNLLGDSTKARTKLGWKPKYYFKDVVKEMVEKDFELAKKMALIKDHGYDIYEDND